MYLGIVNEYSRTKLAGSFLSQYFPLCVCEIWGFFGIAENKRIFSQEIELFSSASMDFAARAGSNRKFHLGLIEGGSLE